MAAPSFHVDPRHARVRRMSCPSRFPTRSNVAPVCRMDTNNQNWDLRHRAGARLQCKRPAADAGLVDRGSACRCPFGLPDLPARRDARRRRLGTRHHGHPHFIAAGDGGGNRYSIASVPRQWAALSGDLYRCLYWPFDPRLPTRRASARFRYDGLRGLRGDGLSPHSFDDCGRCSPRKCRGS